ncbi:MAG: alpha/beta hydrolase-fold protein [Acidobacteriota bacterium]|nr:alpha/beta hydrolase-fold protein [Blastocatellia bacterium]MDW8413435.1 alpha/beta hydrolase-fold protein [Acidobacteriota bacterium]
MRLLVIILFALPVAAQQYLTGNIEYIRGFRSTVLSNSRDIIIYLPPDYYRSNAQYPVFYMHDGQNLFDGNTSFIRGQEWRVDETAEQLISGGEIEPIIIVGVYNAGSQRIYEYTPTVDETFQAGGGGDLYGKFLVEELKPYIDSKYRTLKAAEHTALGGSSLGGLITIYLGLKYPQVFGKLAVMSPSVWWNSRYILGYVNSSAKVNCKIWEDVGTSEGSDFTTKQMVKLDARKLRDALIKKGWELGKDLVYFEAKRAQHNEAAWAARMPEVLKYLFPKK